MNSNPPDTASPESDKDHQVRMAFAKRLLTYPDQQVIHLLSIETEDELQLLRPYCLQREQSFIDQLLIEAKAPFPARKALELVEQYLVDRGIETRGTIGRTIILPAIRAAIGMRPLTSEERFIDRDLFVAYVEAIVNPAREKEQLPTVDRGAAAHLYSVFEGRRHQLRGNGPELGGSQ